MGMDQNSKDQYRRTFLKDRKTGKRWYVIVQSVAKANCSSWTVGGVRFVGWLKEPWLTLKEYTSWVS
jgi:hypothetical protein